jgi:hypothetical protein
MMRILNSVGLRPLIASAIAVAVFSGLIAAAVALKLGGDRVTRPPGCEAAAAIDRADPWAGEPEVYVNPADWDHVVNDLAADDENSSENALRYRELLRKRYRLFDVARGTRACVLGPEHGLLRQVRILDGPNVGLVVWVAGYWLYEGEH